jgi:hypothetical protein
MLKGYISPSSKFKQIWTTMAFQGNDIQMGWVFHAYVILLKGMIIWRAIFKTFPDNNLCIYIYVYIYICIYIYVYIYVYVYVYI